MESGGRRGRRCTTLAVEGEEGEDFPFPPADETTEPYEHLDCSSSWLMKMPRNQEDDGGMDEGMKDLLAPMTPDPEH